MFFTYWITELGPYVLDFLEEHHHQLVEGDLLLALVAQGHIDGALEALEVCHHGAHHAAGQAAAYQKRRADVVVRLYEHAQEIVDESLGESSGLHIGVHVDVLYEESGILQHGLDRDNVRMNLAPGKRLHGHVQIVGTGAGHLQHGGYREAGTRVTVVLYDDMGIFVLDAFGQTAQECRAADAGHVLEADLVAAVFHHLVHDVHVVFYGVNRGISDAERHLGYHAALLGQYHRVFEIAVVVEAAERAGDIGALLGLHLIHKGPDIPGYRIHAEGVEASLKHVRLDADLVEWCGPGSYGLVGILSEEEVHLFERSSVGLDPVEAAHLYNNRRNLHQLVNPGDIFSR